MNRYLPAIVFAATAIIGLGMTYLVWQSTIDARNTRFALVADEAVDRISSRLDEHIALLSTTRALFEVNAGPIQRRHFARFVDALLENGSYGGIQGMGFARLMPRGEEQAAERELAAQYATPISVRPQTSQSFRTPIVLLEPSDERNKQALGYDMFSQADRREAMLRAMNSGKASASAPVELVQEITNEKQAGFLVYLAVENPDMASVNQTDPIERHIGFVYAPFRAGDLHASIIDRGHLLPVSLQTSDITNGASAFLYESPGFAENLERRRYEVYRTAEIAGRTWQFRFVDRPDFNAGVTPVGIILIGSLSLLFAGALAASTHAQVRRIDVANALADQREHSRNRKELLLQEMKHRIKNHIARIQAISRQTASNSANLEEYVSSFSMRLQAMANAQDALTRSHWQRADLFDLVEKELEQVFGKKMEKAGFSGPQVELNEVQAQAMSLVMHELATNALKYGGVTADNGNLSVLWEISGHGKDRTLLFSWIENTDKPAVESEKQGFGSRLIEASVKGELGGKVERLYTPTGLTVRLHVPLNKSFE